MLSPAAVFVVLVAIYPIGRILWLSFFTQNLGTNLQPQFTGTLNYLRVLSDGHYWQTVRTTGLFTFVAVGIELVLGLGLAVLLNENRGLRDGQRRGRLQLFPAQSARISWIARRKAVVEASSWLSLMQSGGMKTIVLRIGRVSRPCLRAARQMR